MMAMVFGSTDASELTKTFNYSHGTTYYWADLGLVTQQKQAKVAAIYPTVSVSSKEESAAYKWDVTASHATKDLLLASAASVTINNATPITLPFGHALHKFSVKLEGESKLTSGAKITCKNFMPIADVNLLTGTVKRCVWCIKINVCKWKGS